MVVTVPDVPSRCIALRSSPPMLGGEAIARALRPRRSSPRYSAAHRHAAVALGQRHTTPIGIDAQPRICGTGGPPCARRAAAQPHEFRGAAADVEQDHALGGGSISGVQPVAASPASVSRSTISSSSRPRAARARGIPAVGGRAAGFGGDQPRARDRRGCASCRGRSQRLDCALDRGVASRPEAAIPSPSRMMRENASMTRKPSRVGAPPAAGSCWCRDRAPHRQGADDRGWARRPDRDGGLASADPTGAGLSAPVDARGRGRTESEPRRP
jgi:hypothetical protein